MSAWVYVIGGAALWLAVLIFALSLCVMAKRGDAA